MAVECLKNPTWQSVPAACFLVVTFDTYVRGIEALVLTQQALVLHEKAAADRATRVFQTEALGTCLQPVAGRRT